MPEMTTTTATVHERPIVFREHEVRATLEGRKTQTRRVIESPQPGSHMDLLAVLPDGEGPNDRYAAVQFVSRLNGDVSSWGCRFGRPGDRLWVRETAMLSSTSGYGGETTEVTLEYRIPNRHHVRVQSFKRSDVGPYNFGGWTPSIYMPRWASRLTLEITEVRVQRVQEISEEDVQAEGCTGSPFGPAGDAFLFPSMWDSIHAKRPGCSWASNCWVWCISFRVLPREASTP